MGGALKRAREDRDAFVRAWPFDPVTAADATVYCLHCERAMSSGDLRLVWEDDGIGGPKQWWVECAFEDCDGSALDISQEPWGEIHKDA
jgi:hypothetical protein